MLTIVYLLGNALVFAQDDSLPKNAGKNNAQVNMEVLNAKNTELKTVSTYEWVNSMPWISAIFISLITVAVNIYISNNSRKTSLKIANTQLIAGLNASNRQGWINLTRDAISEFATQCRLINIEFQDPSNNRERQASLNEKIAFNRNKLKLLLAIHILEHGNLLKAMDDLVQKVDVHMLNNKSNLTNQYDNVGFMKACEEVIEKGRTMLYYEWSKIQNLGIGDDK